MPIICNNVVNGTSVMTDDHKAYNELLKKGFHYDTVCYKYCLVDPAAEAKIQAMYLFKYCIKI